MNENLFTNAHGLRLIQQFEGAPRLQARLCEGGAWELSYGVTFKPDGTRIQEGETCTEDEAMALFRHALGVFERAVRELVTIELTSNQFSALVALFYNIGIENGRTSTVLRETNANRFYDAAAAFGMWVFATKDGYKQAYRGLLRRRYAEACLYLGYDWTRATEDDAIALQREPPATLPGRDKVVYKTPFKDVLAVAQGHPLPILSPEKPAPVDQGGVSAPVIQPLPKSPVPGERVPGSPAALPLPAPKPAPMPAPLPPIGTKPISPNTKMPEHVPYRIDPNAGLKPMEETERFVGAALMLFGTFARVIMAQGTALTGIGGIAVVGILDMMKSPTNLAILVTVITMGITAVLWVVAFIVDKLGLKIKQRGERTSTQAMY